jgi:chemotaxis protein MotB
VVPDPSGEVDAARTQVRARGSGAVATPGAPPAGRVAQPTFELDDLSAADTGPPRSPRRAGSLIPWILLLLTLAAVAFFALRVHIPMREESEDRLAELDDARRDSATLRAQVETLRGEQAQLEAEVEQRQKEVEALQSTQLELVSKLQAEVDKGNVLVKQKHGELVVDLVDKVLFDSGEAELNEKGKEVLLQVGETFSKLEDKLVQVAGHTDAVPISDKLLETFPTNWELSTARATHVVRFLQEQAKIPGKRLAVVGRSEYAPIASNATRAGRRRNRRIEVKLLPLKRKR